MEFTRCVADSEKVLSELAVLVGLNYETGDFSKFEDVFSSSGLEEDFYVLQNEQLSLTVHLEKYEGYFFITISGFGEAFSIAKVFLSNVE